MTYIDTIVNILFWILGSGAIGMILFVLYKESQYKHKIIIKQVNNSIKYTLVDKFRVMKDKDGITLWHLKKNKSKIPPAPNECVEIDNKGHFVVQYYQLDGGEFIPAKDGFDLNDKEAQEEILSKIQPYTHSQRQMMISQYKKSQEDKKKGVLDWLYNATPVIAIIMILAIFMIFFADVIEPLDDLTSKLTLATEHIDDSIGVIENIVQDRVTIDDYEEISQGDGSTPPN